MQSLCLVSLTCFMDHLVGTNLIAIPSIKRARHNRPTISCNRVSIVEAPCVYGMCKCAHNVRPSHHYLIMRQYSVWIQGVFEKVLIQPTLTKHNGWHIWMIQRAVLGVCRMYVDYQFVLLNADTMMQCGSVAEMRACWTQQMKEKSSGKRVWACPLELYICRVFRSEGI